MRWAQGKTLLAPQERKRADGRKGYTCDACDAREGMIEEKVRM